MTKDDKKRIAEVFPYTAYYAYSIIYSSYALTAYFENLGANFQWFRKKITDARRYLFEYRLSSAIENKNTIAIAYPVVRSRREYYCVSFRHEKDYLDMQKRYMQAQLSEKVG